MRSAFSPISTNAVRTSSLLGEFLDGVLAVVFPSDCSLCKVELASDAWLSVCRDCWADLQPWSGPVCARCGLPFVSARALDSSVAECGACRRDEPGFDGARSFGIFTGKLRQSILRVKFAGDERLGERVGGLLADQWDILQQLSELQDPEQIPLLAGGPGSEIESISTRSSTGRFLIVPVPLHPSRRRERGFNQSDLLASGLVKTLRKREGLALELVRGCLSRTRATPPQTGLTIAARRENLRGAFKVIRPQVIRGRVIVLVDDVMTTGATLSACARTLKRAGAAQVLGLTLARATPQFPDLARLENDNTVDGLDPYST